jgi:hypothetical protein
MITKWKRVSALEFVADWQGMRTVIGWSQSNHSWCIQVQATPGYVLSVTGKEALSVKGHWRSHQAAMDAVDSAMQRVVRGKMRSLVGAHA